MIADVPSSFPPVVSAVTDAGTTVISGSLPLALLLALAAGAVSFASPCVLPLVPGFLGYVTGLSGEGIEREARGRLVLGALLFVLGFSVVFISVAVTASALGTLLIEHRALLMRVGGGIVIVMALLFLGFGPQRTFSPRWRPAAGLAGAPLLGIVFGLGMSPCVGPVFGAILTLSNTLSADADLIRRGLVLSGAYCLGLGIPFLLIAGGYARAGRASRWLRDHHRPVQVAGGVLLILVGLLMVTGLWESAMTALQTRLVDGFRTVL